MNHLRFIATVLGSYSNFVQDNLHNEYIINNLNSILSFNNNCARQHALAMKFL